MRKKISFMPLMALLVVLGFSSCMNNAGNTLSVPWIPAVVVSTASGPILNTGFGKEGFGLVSVPDLEGKVSLGDYLYVSLTFDWDNQPVSSMFNCLASLQKTPDAYEIIEHTALTVTNGDLNLAFADSVVGCMINGYVDYPTRHQYSFMMQIGHKAPQNQEYEYQLVCNLDSVSKDTYGDRTYMLYLLAKKSEPIRIGNITNVNNYYGFDISGFVAQGTPGKELKFNIKYIFGNDSKGNPVYRIYKPANADAFSIFVPE